MFICLFYYKIGHILLTQCAYDYMITIITISPTITKFQLTSAPSGAQISNCNRKTIRLTLHNNWCILSTGSTSWECDFFLPLSNASFASLRAQRSMGVGNVRRTLSSTSCILWGLGGAHNMFRRRNIRLSTYSRASSRADIDGWTCSSTCNHTPRNAEAVTDTQYYSQWVAGLLLRCIYVYM